MAQIPKLIFQTASDVDWNNPDLQGCLSDMKMRNPEHAFKFFTNEEATDFVKQHAPKRIRDKLDNLHPDYNVVIADLFRYLVIYEYGGIYLDIKSTITNPLSEVIEDSDEFLLAQWDSRLGKPHEAFGQHAELSRIPGGEFIQWFLIAKPKHPILKRVIEAVWNNIADYSPYYHGVGREGVLRTTGPIAYSLAIAPMLSHHNFRVIDILKAGFVYSIFGEDWSGREKHGHYARSFEPLFSD